MTDVHASVCEPEVERLAVTTEPRRVLVRGEPILIPTKRGYQPALVVFESKKRKTFYIFVGAASLVQPLEMLRSDNGGRFDGLEFWIWKESDEKTAPYRIRT